MITQAETSSSAPVEVAAILGIPFGRLLRVEWSKAVDTRAARWLIAISALATVGIMLAPALAEHSINQTYGNYLGFPALVATTLMPILAVLTMTTEWTQRTVLTTFTQEPRRGRVVTAKVGASLLLGALTAAFVGAVTAVTIWVVEAGGRHLHDRLGPA